MTIRFKAWLLAILCSSFASSVFADNEFASDNSFVTKEIYNSYLSFSAGRSKSQDTCTTTIVPGAYCSELGRVYRMAFGHHFTPTWGMEISYGDFGRAEEKGILPVAPLPALGSSTPYTWTWEAVGWEIAATGTMHFTDALSLNGKLGMIRANVGSEFIVYANNGVWHSVFQENTTKAAFGIGTQYDFNREFAASLQYDYFGKLGNLSQIRTSSVTASFILKF